MKSYAAAVIASVLATGCMFPMMPASGGAGGPGGSSPGGPTTSGGGSPSSAPMASGGGSAPSAPSAPAGPVSVDIRGSCGNTVKVFFGDKPGFGSGTYSSVESNSISSHSFRVGEQMWIVDDHETGVASVTVAAGTHQIEVNCSTISAR